MEEPAQRAVILSGTRVRLVGEFDLSSLDVLQRAVPPAGPSPVIVDLSECTFLDGGVIAFLVGRAQAASGDPERFCLIGAEGQVERILALTGAAGTEWLLDGPSSRRDAALSAV